MLHVCVDLSSGIVDLVTTDRIRLNDPSFSTRAEEGTVATSQLLIDDLASALSLRGWRRCWAYEDTAPLGNQIIWAGFLGDRRIGRKAGGEDEFVVGADRRISAALVEGNTLLSLRVITGASADRPAETDLQRIAWLSSAGYLPGVALTYVTTGTAVNLDAANLEGQTAYQVLSDCANRSNRNFHLVVVDGNSPATGLYTWALVYDYDYAPILTSSLRLSNTRSEIDYATTWPLNPGAELVTTPARIYSGALVRYQGGTTYQQVTATGDAFVFRDTARDASNVSSLAAAQALGARYLADTDQEEDRIEGVEVSLPNTLVNSIREGQRVQVKASHWDAYTSYSYMRVLARTVRQQSDDTYRVTLTLAPLGTTTSSGAQLQSPQSSQFGGGAGTFRVQYDNDGDSPGSGCSALARSGLLAYQGVAGERTGILCNGDGVLTISSHGTMSGVGGGDITMTAYIRVNGTTVSTTSTFSTGGLRALGWTWDQSVEVAVRSGDVIEAYFNISAAPNIFVIPAGVGDCANMLYVRGALR